jgi:endonuclease-3
MDRSSLLERARLVSQGLAQEYPEAACELDHSSPWELLVATVLSAQCTDERVNRITPELFRRWPDPAALAAAPPDQLEETLRPLGFFRSKARSLQRTARQVMADHGGEVPQRLEALIELPGVGRKTAKVVLGVAFGLAAGIAVDTHVRRLSRRLGLSEHQDPERIAADLEHLAPRDEWVQLSLRLVLHGRRVCTARAPRCSECCLEPICPRLGV